MTEQKTDAEVMKVSGPNKDGFSLYRVIEKNNPDVVLGSMRTSVVNQKGFDGSTLRVREFSIDDIGLDPFDHVLAFFNAFFRWNKSDNIKFYFKKKEYIFMFRIFGETLNKKRIIDSIESHSNWVIYKGIRKEN